MAHSVARSWAGSSSVRTTPSCSTRSTSAVVVTRRPAAVSPITASTTGPRWRDSSTTEKAGLQVPQLEPSGGVPDGHQRAALRLGSNRRDRVVLSDIERRERCVAADRVAGDDPIRTGDVEHAVRSGGQRDGRRHGSVGDRPHELSIEAVDVDPVDALEARQVVLLTLDRHDVIRHEQASDVDVPHPAAGTRA